MRRAKRLSLPVVRVTLLVPGSRTFVRILEDLTRRAARVLGWTEGALGVVVTDDRRIAGLNRRFMGHGGATDVLAFDLGSRRTRVIADIVVSRTTAARMARSLGVDVFEETMRYVVHGLLHLAGYDDHAPADRAKMWARQEILLKQVTKSQGQCAAKRSLPEGDKVTRSQD